MNRTEWRGVKLPEAVADATAMLRTEEKQLIYSLAHARDAGTLVDAGCFLGGSTICLAAGAPASTVHVFDLFEFDPIGAKWANEKLNLDRRAGESFRDIFENNVAEYAHQLRVQEGDLLAQSWGGAPIAVLFIDLCKSYELNSHVLREFFPSLERNSFVIHQDFFYDWEPSIPVTMWLLRDHFERLEREDPSLAYRLVKDISPAQIDEVLQMSLDPDIAIPAMAKQLEYGGPMLQVAQIKLLSRMGSDIESEIEAARKKWSHLPWFEERLALSMPSIERQRNLYTDERRQGNSGVW